MHELKKLIEYAPKNRDIFEVAAYYLKNIILLQAFPDANHRTALTAIEMFLEDNGLNLDYTTVELFCKFLQQTKTHFQDFIYFIHFLIR
jgi:death-on-curing family protein